jgi:hypothetical protein
MPATLGLLSVSSPFPPTSAALLPAVIRPVYDLLEEAANAMLQENVSGFSSVLSSGG